MSEEKINLEKVLKEIREAWKETKEHFKIEGDLKIRIKTEDGNILEVLDDE